MGIVPAKKIEDTGHQSDAGMEAREHGSLACNNG
jgi:hypothetical protein